jgi:hypothetical protein
MPGSLNHQPSGADLAEAEHHSSKPCVAMSVGQIANDRGDDRNRYPINEIFRGSRSGSSSFALRLKKKGFRGADPIARAELLLPRSICSAHPRALG